MKLERFKSYVNNRISITEGRNIGSRNGDGIYKLSDNSYYLDLKTRNFFHEERIPFEENKKYRTDGKTGKVSGTTEKLNGKKWYDIAPIDLPEDFYKVDLKELQNWMNKSMLLMGDASVDYKSIKVTPLQLMWYRDKNFKAFKEVEELTNQQISNHPALKQAVKDKNLMSKIDTIQDVVNILKKSNIEIVEDDLGAYIIYE